MAERSFLLCRTPDCGTTKPQLPVALSALPTLQKVVHHFGPRRLANFCQVHFDPVVSILQKRAVRKLDRHVWIRGTKSVSEGFFLNRFAQQEVEKRLGALALLLRAPRSINNVVRVFVPSVVLRVDYTNLPPAPFGVLQEVNGYAIIDEKSVVSRRSLQNHFTHHVSGAIGKAAHSPLKSLQPILKTHVDDVF